MPCLLQPEVAYWVKRSALLTRFVLAEGTHQKRCLFGAFQAIWTISMTTGGGPSRHHLLCCVVADKSPCQRQGRDSGRERKIELLFINTEFSPFQHHDAYGPSLQGSTVYICSTASRLP